tara:strand:- start:35225 stop:35914 length:690 start_codon:yes stop_codon:yes gene_type:complete
MMPKTPIYFVPGLAAGPEIFENLQFDPEKYELHYLKWFEPLALEESLSNYAMRMTDLIKHENPVLVGVSFGGIMVQEMSKFLKAKKVIVISSVKSKKELPLRFKIANISKAYKIFPTKLVSNFENYSQFFVGKTLQKRAKIYKKYLSERGEKYLKWSVKSVVKWNQEEAMEGVIHIHGTKDAVFPYERINDAISIEGGTHIMILTRAKEISTIIQEKLSTLQHSKQTSK